MKFNDWTLDALIEYLKKCKSGDFDPKCVIRARGEIQLYNGEMRTEYDI